MIDLDAHLVEELLAEHLRAVLVRDVDAFVAGYSEDAVLMTPEATMRYSQLRDFAEQFFQALPSDASTLNIVRQDIVGNVAYVSWSAQSPYLSIPLAADTFVFREDLIIVHTFGGQMIPRGS